MRIRNYLIVGFICALLFIAWIIADAYATNSELAPEDIFMWKVVEVSEIDINGRYYLVAENPKLRLPVECSIPYVLIRALVGLERLIGYAYYKYGKLYIFELIEEERFEQVKVILRKKEVIDYFLKPFLDRLPEDKKKEQI